MINNAKKPVQQSFGLCFLPIGPFYEWHDSQRGRGVVLCLLFHAHVCWLCMYNHNITVFEFNQS